ncbi:response regulator [Desulfoprunum benzoelyticum]|nr:response regulator [Desulfoprunum benzoelyticum]
MKDKSLLVVDDEPIIRNSLARDLAIAGLTATTAADGEEAVALIDANAYDIVITDLVMPRLNGLQVLEAAKQRRPMAIVIILTGNGVMESAIDALRLGADDFLQKPCDTDELLYRMSTCLVKQAMQRKIALYEEFLPMCCYCKKIRDDQQGKQGEGRWYSLEEYFNRTKGVRISHGCCPDCYAEQIKNLHSDRDEPSSS